MAQRLFIPPRMYVAEQDAHRKATWLELFYDLVYVATIVQLGDYLSDNVTGMGVLEYIILFIPIWWSWVGTTIYADRFDSDDVLHRLLVFIQVYTVGTMALFVYDGLGETAPMFALAYAANRFLLVLMYVRARIYVPEAIALTTRYIVGFSIAAVIWFVSAFMPAPLIFLLWALAVAVDLYTPLSMRSRMLQMRLPPSPHHLPERFALLTIIVFGESFLKIIGGLAGESITFSTLVANSPSLVIAGALWWIYFDNVAEARIRWGGRSAQAWMYTHLPFQAGVAALGVGMYKLITLDPTKPLPDNYRWLICGATAIVLVTLAILERATEEHRGHRMSQMEFGARIIGAGLILLIGAFASGADEVIVMSLLAVICTAQVVYDLYLRAMSPASEHSAGSEGVQLAGSD